MSRPNATSEEVAGCMRVLESAKGPLVAADIAVRLGLSGKRETQRRRVRELIKMLRDNGVQITATLNDGYMLTDDINTNKEYLGGRQMSAKRVLGDTNKKMKTLFNNQGQGLLFRPGGIRG